MARFYHECLEHGSHVQHIIYDPAEFVLLHRLFDTGCLNTERPQLLFVLGQYGSTREALPEDLLPFLEALKCVPGNPDWMTCSFGANEAACLEYTLRRGGKVRVGFENNLYSRPGVLAANNAEQVANISAAWRQIELSNNVS